MLFYRIQIKEPKLTLRTWMKKKARMPNNKMENGSLKEM